MFSKVKYCWRVRVGRSGGDWKSVQIGTAKSFPTPAKHLTSFNLIFSSTVAILILICSSEFLYTPSSLLESDSCHLHYTFLACLSCNLRGLKVLSAQSPLETLPLWLTPSFSFIFSLSLSTSSFPSVYQHTLSFTFP